MWIILWFYYTGKAPRLDHSKIVNELGFTFRDAADTFADTCQWLIDNGHVRAL
jgi:nucleoside-diphosphate-sugar epimerase